MSDISNVAWSYLIAVLIGVVVSLDVGGLLISQHKEFKKASLANPGPIFAHAGLHAFVHSMLFIVYVTAVQIALLVLTILPESFFEFTRYIASFFHIILPPIDAAEAVKTIVLLSSLIVCLLVWFTYSAKIVEDHSGKLKTGNPLAGSRFDIQAIYGMVRSTVDNNRNRIRVAMALAVAVDMLAISSIIRVYFKGAMDAGQSAGAEADAKLLHFNFGVGGNFSEVVNNLIQPLIFAVIIFLVVFLCAFGAILISKGLSAERHVRVLVRLRILEPFLVFWILIASVDHLFGFPPEHPFDILTKVAVGAPVSLILTALIVRMRTWGAICAAVKAGANVTTDRLEDTRQEDSRDPEHFRRVVKHTFIIVLFWIMSFVLIFYAAFQQPHPEQTLVPGSGITRFIEFLSIYLNLVVLIFLYVPYRKFLNLETELNGFFFKELDDVNYSGLIYTTAACLLILLYIHVSYVRSDLFTMHSNEYFILPILYLCAVTSFAWALALTRHARLLDLARRRGVAAENTLSVGDGLNSLAVVVFAFQTVLLFGQKLL